MNDLGRNGIVNTAKMTLDKTPPHSRAAGVSASFVRMNSGMPLGVKSFTHEDERDRSYAIQEYLSKHGLAPKVFAKFQCEDHGQTRYCLVTECVDYVGSQLIRYDGSEQDAQYYKMASDLDKRIQQVGLYPEDLHNANWGLLNGKPVAIDVAYFEVNPLHFDKTGDTPPDCAIVRELHF